MNPTTGPVFTAIIEERRREHVFVTQFQAADG
jgi:hypothetical protein